MKRWRRCVQGHFVSAQDRPRPSTSGEGRAGDKKDLFRRRRPQQNRRASRWEINSQLSRRQIHSETTAAALTLPPLSSFSFGPRQERTYGRCCLSYSESIPNLRITICSPNGSKISYSTYDVEQVVCDPLPATQASSLSDDAWTTQL